MAEYIDKAVALSIHEPPKSNRYYQTDNLDDAYGQGWDDALCCIEKIPVADVAPVVYARWITRTDKGVISMTHPYMCSRCWRVEMNKEPYCNCGAKMQEEQNNETRHE